MPKDFSRSRTPRRRPRPRMRRNRSPTPDDNWKHFVFRFAYSTPEHQWAWSEATGMWHYRKWGSYSWFMDQRHWCLCTDGEWRLVEDVGRRFWEGARGRGGTQAVGGLRGGGGPSLN